MIHVMLARSVFVALLWAATPACAPAAQAEQDDAALAELVHRLGESDPEARDRAEDLLRKAGNRAEAVLLRARTESDAEVRLRAERLLGEIERGKKQQRLKQIPDPPILVLVPDDLPQEIHRVALKSGKAEKVVAHSGTISGLQRDDPSGRLAYYLMQEGLEILSPGHTESETATPLEVRNPRGIAWSPSGGSLVLVSETRPVGGGRFDSDGTPRLYLFTPFTKELVGLTPEKQGYFEPSWSPDGRQLAFVRNDSMSAKGADVYRMTVAPPRVPVRLTTDDAAKSSIGWSPDGRWIAFEWTLEPSLGVLSLEDPKSAPRRLGQGGRSPVWSPDSSMLAYTRGESHDEHGELRIVGRDGTKDRVLVGGQGHKGSPAWSPDGRMIAFNWAKERYAQVYVVNADGTGLRQLTSFAEGARDPVWAPQE